MVTANPDFSSAVFVKNPTVSDYRQVKEWRNVLAKKLRRKNTGSQKQFIDEFNKVEQFLKQV